MLRRVSFLTVVALLVMIVGVLQVSAEPNITSYFPGCSSFTISGSTEEPYITLEVFDDSTQQELVDDLFPVNVDGTFSEVVTFPTQEIGHVLFYNLYENLSSDPHSISKDIHFSEETACRQEPLPVKKVVGAPGIPAGFVFASTICNTPVYDTPAGQPVGAAAVTAGQTWYVNPTPVTGDDGKQWTEIYVSSTTNPYIPTACVQ